MDDTLGSNYIIIRRGILFLFSDVIIVGNGANSSGQINDVNDVIDADEPEPLRDTYNRLRDGPIVLRYAGWIE